MKIQNSFYEGWLIGTVQDRQTHRIHKRQRKTMDKNDLEANSEGECKVGDTGSDVFIGISSV